MIECIDLVLLANGVFGAVFPHFRLQRRQRQRRELTFDLFAGFDRVDLLSVLDWGSRGVFHWLEMAAATQLS